MCKQGIVRHTFENMISILVNLKFFGDMDFMLTEMNINYFKMVLKVATLTRHNCHVCILFMYGPAIRSNFLNYDLTSFLRGDGQIAKNQDEIHFRRNEIQRVH